MKLNSKRLFVYFLIMQIAVAAGAQQAYDEFIAFKTQLYILSDTEEMQLKIKNIKDLKDGAKVAIAYDPSNGNRALRILEKAGLIEIDKNVKVATINDITKNPKNLQFVELEGAQIPRTLDDVDIAAISTNFVLDLGMSVAKDALLLEDANSPYANIIVTRAGNENSPKIKALVDAVLSPDTKNFIITRYKGEVIPAF